MPTQTRTINSSQLASLRACVDASRGRSELTVNRKASSVNFVNIVNLLNVKEGFAFIEIFLGLLVFGVIVIMLASASGSVFTRRHVDQQAIASKVASRELESARNQAFDTLTGYTSRPCSNQQIQGDQAKDLPGCTISLTVCDYSTCATNSSTLKYVSITVQWVNEKGLPGSNVINSKTGQTGVTMDTLISKDAGTGNAGN